MTTQFVDNSKGDTLLNALAANATTFTLVAGKGAKYPVVNAGDNPIPITFETLDPTTGKPTLTRSTVIVGHTAGNDTFSITPIADGSVFPAGSLAECRVRAVDLNPLTPLPAAVTALSTTITTGLSSTSSSLSSVQSSLSTQSTNVAQLSTSVASVSTATDTANAAAVTANTKATAAAAAAATALSSASAPQGSRAYRMAYTLVTGNNTIGDWARLANEPRLQVKIKNPSRANNSFPLKVNFIFANNGNRNGDTSNFTLLPLDQEMVIPAGIAQIWVATQTSGQLAFFDVEVNGVC